mgnify:CR=1 FL=1
MTTFWSTWICVLTIGSLIGLTWLLVGTRKGETKGSVDQTMGHSFDGIEEYDNPLPQWWFMLFAGTLVFSVGYLILYPGLGNWKGILPGYEDGWTGVHEWEKEMAKADARFGPIFAKFAAMPIEEVMAAWRQGWTGRGVNVMIEDNIENDHGVVTGLLAYRYAPGANYYGVQVIPRLNSTQVFDNQLGQFHSSYAGNVKLGVVNASYTAQMNSLIGREQSLQNPWTSDELIIARTDFTWEATITVNRFKDSGVIGSLAQFKYTDAVITKAAGNDQISSEYEPVNWFMAKDSLVNPRLLLVGALDRTGSVADQGDQIVRAVDVLMAGV